MIYWVTEPSKLLNTLIMNTRAAASAFAHKPRKASRGGAVFPKELP